MMCRFLVPRFLQPIEIDQLTPALAKRISAKAVLSSLYCSCALLFRALSNDLRARWQERPGSRFEVGSLGRRLGKWDFVWNWNCLVGEASHDLPSRQLRRRDSMRILSLATSTCGFSSKSPSSDEVDSWTAPCRMPMMTGRIHLWTSSTPGRQLMMSETTCCSQRGGMTATRHMVLPSGLRMIVWPGNVRTRWNGRRVDAIVASCP